MRGRSIFSMQKISSDCPEFGASKEYILDTVEIIRSDQLHNQKAVMVAAPGGALSRPSALALGKRHPGTPAPMREQCRPGVQSVVDVRVLSSLSAVAGTKALSSPPSLPVRDHDLRVTLLPPHHTSSCHILTRARPQSSNAYYFQYFHCSSTVTTTTN